LFGPFSTHGDQVWKRIIWPAHMSVLLRESGFHGYNIIMDTSERQWQIG
jgi:hypothetical protein